jgi:histidine ammonia-lyase
MQGQPVVLAPAALIPVGDSRATIERLLDRGRTVYGVNTGFGKLAEVHVPAESLEPLPVNRVRSHACGLGPALSVAESRAMLLLRAKVLAKGLSGVRPVVVERLTALLHAHLAPVIPQMGSAGAGGDLAPRAHLAPVAMGEGEVFFQGERVPAAPALEGAG